MPLVNVTRPAKGNVIHLKNGHGQRAEAPKETLKKAVGFENQAPAEDDVRFNDM